MKFKIGDSLLVVDSSLKKAYISNGEIYEAKSNSYLNSYGEEVVNIDISGHPNTAFFTYRFRRANCLFERALYGV